MSIWDYLTHPMAEIIRIACDVRPEIKTEEIETEEEKRAELLKGMSTNNKVNIFRPTNFSEYIGQEKAKDILKSYISATKQREKIFPHVLIHGKPGCGKTTLARIIANELGVKFTETMTSEITNFYGLLFKINLADGGILFLDEIHSLERTTAESIYTIMEDFTFEGRPVKPFTLIGATTELGEIIKDRKPFYDRFKIIIELEDYTPEEITKIVYQYKQNSFPTDLVSNPTLDIIGKNSRGTPRNGIRLLEATVYLNGDIKRTLKNFSVIYEGYTLKDLKLLEYLNNNPKGVGLQGLVAYLDIDMESYVYNVEPFLLQNGLVVRTPRGRKISDSGKKKIEELRAKL